MSRINPGSLSETYCVVAADQVDFDELYALYCSNQEYFDYFSLAPTKKRLIKDMTMLPDRCTKDQKIFLVFTDKGKMTAILDLIDGYPDDKTCYIGLFMVEESLHGYGIGTRIITELCDALKETGCRALRLAYGYQNAPAVRFWTKNGFVPLREAVHEEYGEVVVAERKL